MVDCAEYGEPPPIELRLAWDCQHWNTLPDAGGLYDQDYQLTFRMRALSNVYDVITKMRALHGREIHRLSEGERRLLRSLKDLGLIFNG